MLAGLARFEPSWLPYVAEPSGALIAGGALARQGSGHRFEAFAAGALSVAMIAAVAFTTPSTFGWIAIRSAHPRPVAIALAIACGAAAHAGLRAAYGRGGLLSIVVLSTAVGWGLLLFCARIVVVFSVREFSLDSNAVATMLCLPAFVAGSAVQSVGPLANAGACASGIGIVVVLQIIDGMSRGHMVDGSLFWMLLMVAAAFVGALAAQGVRSTLQASDE